MDEEIVRKVIQAEEAYVDKMFHKGLVRGEIDEDELIRGTKEELEKSSGKNE